MKHIINVFFKSVTKTYLDLPPNEKNVTLMRDSLRKAFIFWSLQAVAEALGSERGTNAASLAVAENYVAAFGKLAKSTNTVLLPSNPGDVSGMVSQAMAIYKKLDTMDTRNG